MQDEVVKSLSVIDAKHRRSFTNLDALLKRFPNLVREENIDQLDLEWREFQHTDLPECSSESFPVDKFWKNIGDTKMVRKWNI